MITSTSSADRTLRPELQKPAGKPAQNQVGPRQDQISTGSAEFLRAELKRQPEVRSEVVARARELAADPSYPPTEVIQRVAEQILNSPDLSEDES